MSGPFFVNKAGGDVWLLLSILTRLTHKEIS
jgi:hypothetical protein